MCFFHFKINFVVDNINFKVYIVNVLSKTTRKKGGNKREIF
nr:MAG TPA: hypothetical protein [Caudoviricetes sp.]